MCLRICLLLYLITTPDYNLYSQDTLYTVEEISNQVVSLEEDVVLLEESLETLINSDPIAEYDLLKILIETKDSLNKLLAVQNDVLLESLESNRKEEEQLSQEIDVKTKQYGAVMKAMLRRKLLRNDWLYLLSAESLQKAWVRFRHIRQLERFVVKERAILTDVLNEKEETIRTINNQLLKIKHNQQKLVRSLEELKEIEQTLSVAVDKILKDRAKAERILRQKQKRKNATSARIKKKANDTFSMNNDRPVINDSSPRNKSFVSMRGKLSWPVEGGVIVEKFGRRPHDVVPNVWIENNGVGIMTRKGNSVKAVYKGVVKEIPEINEDGYMIIIEHGDYLTSYYTMASTFVRKGDYVNEGQIIGTISKSASLNPIVHFEVWRGYKKLNPAHWLTK